MIIGFRLIKEMLFIPDLFRPQRHIALQNFFFIGVEGFRFLVAFKLHIGALFGDFGTFKFMFLMVLLHGLRWVDDDRLAPRECYDNSKKNLPQQDFSHQDLQYAIYEDCQFIQ